MTWTWRQARAAADRVRVAPLFHEVITAVRPRGVMGLVRARGPLPLLLFVAAQHGLIVEQDDGGFAVLQRPLAGAAAPSGGSWLRLLRWVVFRWDFVLFAGPPLIFLGLAIAMAPFSPLLIGALTAAVASMAWICVFLTGMFVYQLRWLASLGSLVAPEGGRDALSLPAWHWSVALVHLPDPARAEELIASLSQRLNSLLWSDLQKSASGKVRVARPSVTETLVVLKRGISTQAAREAIQGSMHAVTAYPSAHEVILIEPPGRLERVPSRPAVGGGFVVLYLLGLACAIGVCAAIVASTEAQACLLASCVGRPATFTLAMRWLLQRLLFTDPPDLSPALTRNVVLGWLVSVASAVGILVALVAGRQEILRNRQLAKDHDAALMDVVGRTRILFLVVTELERDAVLACARQSVGKDAVLDTQGERVVFGLGRLAGKELMLVQAPEQGAEAAAGMLTTAEIAIAQCRPDIVILTGICYGLRPDEGQELADVVIARRVQNVDHKKITQSGDTTDVLYRGVNVGSSANLLSKFQTAVGWARARVHTGTMLTSGTLVDSVELVTQLRNEFPEAIAGDMESTAVYEAATQTVKPDWIVIKGISDWGYRKSDQAQLTAATNAASFAMHVIATVQLPNRAT